MLGFKWYHFTFGVEWDEITIFSRFRGTLENGPAFYDVGLTGIGGWSTDQKPAMEKDAMKNLFS